MHLLYMAQVVAKVACFEYSYEFITLQAMLVDEDFTAFAK